MTVMRLQKYLAMNGVASRRKCEELIVGGHVDVNGKPVLVLGTKVDPDRDHVSVDGERLKSARRFYVALHKPKGVVCTSSDPAGRPLAIDLVADVPARLFPIGRLDTDIEGLLLLTNDGDFAQQVAHPRYEVAKTYRVVLKGEPDPAALEKLREGIWLSEGKTMPAKIFVLRKTRESTTLTITIQEGKNREVHRMLARVGMPVTRLLRDQIGPVRLGTLKRGEWRMLLPWEIEGLRRSVAERAAAAAAVAARKHPEAHTGPHPPEARSDAGSRGRGHAGAHAGARGGRPGGRPRGGHASGRPDGRPTGRPDGRPNRTPGGRPNTRPSGHDSRGSGRSRPHR